MKKLFLVLWMLLWAGTAQAQVWPNEPTGAIVLTDQNYSCLVCNGWGLVGGPVVASDSTAPLSPSNVLQITFPDGHHGGQGNGNSYYPLNNLRQIYAGIWWKPSSTWNGGSGGQKINFVMSNVGTWNAVLLFNGNRKVSVYFPNTVGMTNPQVPGASGTPIGTQMAPNISNPTLTLGVWHRLEFYVKMSTTASSQDGILRWWINGALSGNLTNVNFPQNNIGQYENNPTWGNVTDVKVGTHTMNYDHVHLSTGGSGGGGTPPDTTAPGTTGSLSAPATSSTSTLLNWTTNAVDTGGSGLRGTVILRSTGAGVPPTQALTTVNAPATTYLDNTLAAGTTYNYRVQGIDNAGNLGPLGATVVYTTAVAGSGTITIDSVADSVANNTSAILPVFAHTVAAGSNRLLNVCTQARGAQASVSVSTLTYGGTGLTFIRGDTRTDGAGQYFRTELWRLIAPAVGTANVAVTFTGVPSSYGAATSISYQGVDQTTPIEASAGGSNNTSATLAVPITTLTSDAWIQDCAIGRADTPSGFVSVGAGQVVRSNRLVNTTDSIGVSTVNGKTPAGSETMDWAQASASDWVLTTVAIKPASSSGTACAPVIDSYTRTATTLTVGYGTGCAATLPTYLRIFEGSNAGTSPPRSVEYTRAVPPFDSSTATTAIMTLALLPGADFSCIYARDASHVENQNANDYKCFPTTGLAPIDTAAPVLGSVRANGNTAAPQLPNGATTFTLSVSVDKSVTCLWDTTTHASYDLFPTANTMSLASLTASATISSGVPAYPATQVYKIMCQFTDAQSTTHDSSEASITVSAAAPAGDTTPPSAVTGVVATALSQSQVSLAWNANAGGDGVTGYTPVCSFGAGNTTYVSCANETLLTTVLLNLPASTVVNTGVLAHDAAGNISSISNISTVTTTALPDLNPPTNPGTLSVATYSASAILSWIPNATDGEGTASTLVEQCSQVAAPIPCTDFAFKKDQIADHVVAFNLASATNYCWRIWHVDQASNKSLAPSNVVCAMTKASGLPIPRTPVPFPGRTQVPE